MARAWVAGLLFVACGGQTGPTGADASMAPDVDDAAFIAWPDAAPEVGDASHGWCGGVSCDWATEYCVTNGVGQPSYDDGKCTALPAQCSADRTCTCLTGTFDGGCVGCLDRDGGLFEGCWEP